MPPLCWKAVLVLHFGALCVLAPSVGAENVARPGAFRVDPPTLHSLGIRWYLQGDDDGDATCAMQYRQVGEERWLEALPLLRVNREELDRDFEHYGANGGRYRVGNLLAGSILFLKPDTKYEVQLTLRDPDGGEAVHRPPLRGHRLQQQRIAPGPRRLARDVFWQP